MHIDKNISKYRNLDQTKLAKQAGLSFSLSSLCPNKLKMTSEPLENACSTSCSSIPNSTQSNDTNIKNHSAGSTEFYDIYENIENFDEWFGDYCKTQNDVALEFEEHDKQLELRQQQAQILESINEEADIQLRSE